MASQRPKIILVGGGTLGSVSPLLAVASRYVADYLFLGSYHGPEKEVVGKAQIDYKPIYSGKLRRYFSWQNFVDIFRIKVAFWQSLYILWRWRPDLMLTAGSFVAVPAAWAAWILRIPVIVHQQDIQVGLANKIMAPIARKITVTLFEQIVYFKSGKTVVTGNPTRWSAESKEGRPIVLITGGGLGARSLNDFLAGFIAKLTRVFEVHHILGSHNWDQRLSLPNYVPHRFIADGLADLVARSEFIISRAGMSMISEAASHKKAIVLVPIAGSHQEKNAAWLAKQNSAIMVHQGSTQIMGRYLDKLLASPELRQALGENLYNTFPQNAVNDYIILINEVLKRP